MEMKIFLKKILHLTIDCSNIFSFFVNVSTLLQDSIIPFPDDSPTDFLPTGSYLISLLFVGEKSIGTLSVGESSFFSITHTVKVAR